MTPNAQVPRPLRAAARLLPLSFVALALYGIVLAWTAPPALASAQEAEEPQAEQPEATEPAPTEAELDDAPRATPRSALRGFQDAVRERAFEEASLFLDLRQSGVEPESAEAAELARQLSIVLSRQLWLDPGLLSGDPAGNREDGLERDVEQLGRIAADQGDVAILMTRSGAEPREWRFAASTVQRIPALYAVHGYGWIEEVLPRPFFELTFMDVQLWQWIGLLIAVLLASIAGFIAAMLLVRIARAFTRRTSNGWDDWLIDELAAPVRLWLSIIAFWLLSHALALGATAQGFIDTLCKAATVFAITWMILRVVDVLARIAHQKLALKDASTANTLVPMGRRVTKGFVIVLAAISLIHNLGFNAAGLLTGLGVGGLAVALAAQKTLENLFGGIAVIADKPVEVGQYCKVGEHAGTVEDIGLRSTRVRTGERTVVTIPNSEFSSQRIENFALRDRMLIHTTLGVAYDTSPDQIRWLLVELRRLLLSHPKVSSDPARVRFVGLGAYSLDLEIFAYVATADFNEFLQVREDVLLRVMDLVAQSGATFAFPSQTIYLGRDQGRDADRSEQTEQAVRAWREQNKLPLPDLPEAERKAIAGSIAYPAEGSVRG